MRVIDLDKIAAEIEKRRPDWVRRGLRVGELTWQDSLARWPQPIVTDPASVREPRSLGLTFQGPKGREAELCLWPEGWADLTGWMDDDILFDAPQYEDEDSCIALIESVANRVMDVPA